jgi:hypothetical protein
LADFGARPFYKNVYAHPAYFFDYFDTAMRYRLTINPVIGLMGGRDLSSDDRLLYQNTRGLEVKGFLGKGEKIGFYSIAKENQIGLPDFVNYYTDSMYFLPNEAFWKRFKNKGYDYFRARGNIFFNVTEFATIRFGHDRHFVGNGIRSLVMSDYAPQNLFLQINTNIGRFNYQNYFAELTDFSRLTGGDLLRKKYMTFHRLGVNIGRNLNIGVFEAVMFDRQDSTQSNQFDINYLNPIIFYRAIEQNLGSQDNALVGIDWKWNFFKHFQFYGQFILDEFKLDELQARTGWWANKHGTQAGVKYIDVFGLKNIDIQAEYNSVRPYTYSHFRSGGNWAHYGQPLAHPFGANFREFIVRLHAQPLPRLQIIATAIMAEKGEDFFLKGDNYGGNILRNYSQRVQDYGNTTLQGKLVKTAIAELFTSYMITHNLSADLRLYYRKKSSDNLYPNTTWVSGGVRWNLPAQLRNMYY